MINSPIEIILGLLLIVFLAFVAVRSKAIDLPGAFSGSVISFVAFLAGGFPWLIIIVVFFGVSSALTRYRYEYKRRIGSAEAKSGMRSWPNTVANVGVACAASLLEIFIHGDIFALAYLGSISAAMSDTLATEVGLLSRSKPRLITNLKHVVTKGTSGGISALGELTAFLSSLGVGVLGLLIVFPSRLNFLGVALILPSVLGGGFTGTTLDSLVGAKLEGVRRCQVCGELVSDFYHHAKKTVIVRGLERIDNNVVNFACTLTGAVVSIVIYFLLSQYLPP